MSEKEKGERKPETYESLINGILRSVWGIEMKHGIWQWNHGNHIEKDRIIVVDPKMENKTCNTDRKTKKKQNLKMAKSKNEKDRKMRYPWWMNKNKTRKCEQHRKLMRNEDKKERMN